MSEEEIKYTCGLALGNCEMRVVVIRRGEGERLPRTSELVASENGRRSTAAAIAYAASGEWLIGDAAESQYAKNAKGTLSQILCLIPRENDDLNGDALRARCLRTKQKVQVVSVEEAIDILRQDEESDEAKKDESKKLSSSVKKIKRTNKVEKKNYTKPEDENFSFSKTEWPAVVLEPCQGVRRVLTVEMAIYMVLNKLRKLVDDFCASGVARDGTEKNVSTLSVLSLPSDIFESDIARSIITAAAKKAHIYFMQIISDAASVLLAHGLDENKINATCFILDVGGSASRCDCFYLTNGGVATKLIQTHCSFDFCCTALTSKLEHFCANQILRRQKIDINDGGEKARRRLRLACASAAKILATTKPGQADIEAEALVDGIDCRVRVTKARYDDMCSDIYRQLGTLIDTALDDLEQVAPGSVRLICVGAGAKNDAILSIAERSLMTRGLLDESIQNNVNRRIDPEEAAAFGAAKQAGLIVFGLDPSRDTPATWLRTGKKGYTLRSSRLDSITSLGDAGLPHTTEKLAFVCLPTATTLDVETLRDLLQQQDDLITIAPRFVPLPYQTNINNINTSSGALLVVFSIKYDSAVRLPLAACQLPRTDVSLTICIDSHAKLTISILGDGGQEATSSNILLECSPPPISSS